MKRALAGFLSLILACSWLVDDEPPRPDAALPSAAGSGRGDAAVPPASIRNPRGRDGGRDGDSGPDADLSHRGETAPAPEPVSGCFLSRQGESLSEPVHRGLADWTFAGLEAGDGFGSSLAGAGDVNGDGVGDFVVGAPGVSRGSGAAFIWLGDASRAFALPQRLGAAMAPGFVVWGAAFGDGAGTAVASAGDVNRDGFDDVIVGAPGVRVEGLPAVGAAYVVFGAVAPFSISLVDVEAGRGGFAIFGSTVGQNLGYSVAGAGDVDGDGFDDVVVGAPGSHTDATGSTGAAFIVFGAANPASVFTGAPGADGARISALLDGPAGRRWGGAVAGVGDVDGDGLDDWVLTTGDTASTLPSTPIAHLFSRTDSALSIRASNKSPWIRGALLAPSGSLGVDVAGAGDVDGNGLDDVVACSFRAGASRAQVASDRNWVSKHEALFPEVRDAGAALGSLSELTFESVDCSVAAGGDGDGDGRGDWLVGAPEFETEAGAAAGRVWVASSNALDPIAFSGDQAGERLGHSVALLADVDADGLDDFLFGAPGRNGAAGAAFLLFGCSEFLDSGRASPQFGGRGDDAFAYDGRRLGRVSGGNGEDTLEFRGRGLVLDLRDSLWVGDIERIDLRGGRNTLVLDDASVRRLPQHRPGLTPPLAKTLVVLGEKGDVLVFDIAGYEAVPGGQAGRRVLRRAGAYYGLEVGSQVEIRSP